MAIQTLEIDPNAADDQTGDEIIAAINSATSQITRDDSIDFDALDIVRTGPPSGGFKIKRCHRLSTGFLQFEYDDVPEP